MRARTRLHARTALLAGAVVGTMSLTACGAAGGGAAPTWVPQPSFAAPGEPNPGGSGSAGTPAAPTSPGGSGSSSGSTQDPAVVATGLTAPTGLTLLPDGSALVGERTTGRIVQVQPQPGQPVTPVRTLTGLDTAGDGGLLDLATSPTYDEDGLIYAYETTATDNRVVTFTRSGPVTPVLTGIPRGSTGNGARMLFGQDGDLYLATGSAGGSPTGLAGAVLRVNSIGKPVGASAVYAPGFAGTTGLCETAGGALIQVAAGSGGRGSLNLVTPAHTTTTAPLSRLSTSATSPGGCATIDSELYVASRDGRQLLSAALKGTAAAPVVGAYTPLLTGKYGRLLTVVADSQGALWITTSNKDGKGKPVAADDRVLHIVPSGSGPGTQI